MSKKKFKRNKEAEEHLPRYQFYRDSYRGGDEYREGGYLEQHEMETDGSFKRRLNQAMYANFCAPVVDTYTSYIFREKIVRTTDGIPQEVADAYLADADMEGRTHARVMRELSKHAGINGIMGVIVDKPAGRAPSRQAELAMDLRPYIAVYNPDKVIDWEYKRINGRMTLTRLVLEEGHDGDVTYYKEWTLTNWTLYKQEKNKNAEFISTGANPLGVIPFVPFKNRDNFERMSGISDICDIADVNRKIYDLDSKHDEIVERTAFPFLEAPYDPDGSNEEGTEVIGTSNILERPDGDATGHRWVEPNHNSLQRIMEKRQELKEDIRTMAKIGSSEATKSQGPEAGVSLELRFQQLNAILADKAESAEDAEKLIFKLIAMWERTAYTGTVEYPRKFGVRDLAYDLDQAIKATSLVPSRTFQTEQAKNFAGRILKDADPETIKKINKELEEKPMIESIPDDGGNPPEDAPHPEATE